MKNTITTTTQAGYNYLNAAERIMDLMEDLGFMSELKHDPEMVRHTISQIIRENIEGNVNYSYAMIDDEPFEPLGIPRNGR